MILRENRTILLIHLLIQKVELINLFASIYRDKIFAIYKIF